MAVGDKSAAGVTGDGGYTPNDGSGPSNNSKRPAGARTGGTEAWTFPPCRPVPTPRLTMKQLVLRALYDNERRCPGLRSRSPASSPTPGTGQSGGYTIARVVISCCAADANPMRVHVAGTAPYPANTWVTAVVQAEPGTGTPANDYVPGVIVKSIEQTSQPSDPYEH